MINETRLRVLRKAFCDITKGFSSAFFNGKKIFIKHFSHYDQTELDVLYKSFVENGLTKGLPSNETRINELLKDGEWTQQNEDDIKFLEKRITDLKKSREAIFKKSDLEKQNKVIKEEEKKLQKILEKKDELIGKTAEKYANRCLNEYYVKHSLFLDDKFNIPFLPEEDFDNLLPEEYSRIISFYNEETKNLDERAIKEIAIQDFFMIYWNVAENDVYRFYGKPICELTYNQLNLSIFANIFKNALKEPEKIPEKYRYDPDELLNYLKMSDNLKEKLEKDRQKISKKNDNEGDGAIATSVMGQSIEEMKASGVDVDSADTINLAEVMKKRQKEGKGSIGMREFAKMIGVKGI